MMKQKLLVLRGIPASGKSTFARKWVLEDPTKRVIVSRDGLRHMLGKYWVGERENLVTEMENSNIYLALTRGYDVCIDSTGFRFTDEQRSSYIRMFDLEIEDVDFTTVPLDVCIERDSKREVPVGAELIIRFYNQYVKPKE